MNLKHIPILNLLTAGRPLRRRMVALLLILAAPIIVSLFVKFTEANQLERIKRSGQLIVATRNAPTTYYQGSNGESGFEYDMLKLFAEELGAELVIKTPSSFGDILPMVSGRTVHMAAAGITATDKRREKVEFGPTYMSITQQLIYRSKLNKRPKNLGDTVGKSLEVIANSSHEEHLEVEKERYPELTWTANLDADVDELINKVNEGEIDFTIADSNDVKVSRRYMPEVRVAFNLTEPEPLAWAFPKGQDKSLLKAAQDFFSKIQESGQLTQLTERHFGHIKRFDYVDKRTLLRHIEDRLPLYELSFRQASQETGIDWRLLAAVGYQESHWDPNATSPTGVRGLMMLTQRTAAQMGVSNRLDPRQSIFGGARYLKLQIEKIPERIEEPDRSWMGIAAYNVGYGHLEDARILAQQLDKSPDTWIDLKSTLPLLSKKKYYQKTRYGYARGWEPVHYVQNIRDYYEVLVWYSQRGEEPETEAPAEPDLRDAAVL